MTESEKFSTWVDLGALLSYERQLHLADVAGDHLRWDVDLTGPTLTLTLADRQLVCHAQLLGSAAPGPRSWLWGWANGNVAPGAVVLAGQLRDLGEAEGVPELTTAEIPFGDAGIEPPHAFWYRLATAVGGMARGFDAYYRAPLGGGTLAPVFIAHEELRLPPVDGPRLTRVLAEGLAANVVADHRRAIAGYAQQRGIPFAWDHPGQGRLTLPDGELTVEFDDEARLTRMAGSFGGG